MSEVNSGNSPPEGKSFALPIRQAPAPEVIHDAFPGRVPIPDRIRAALAEGNISSRKAAEEALIAVVTEIEGDFKDLCIKCDRLEIALAQIKGSINNAQEHLKKTEKRHEELEDMLDVEFKKRNKTDEENTNLKLELAALEEELAEARRALGDTD
jgi:chromosome segregation ATPase